MKRNLIWINSMFNTVFVIQQRKIVHAYITKLSGRMLKRIAAQQQLR